MLSQKFESFTTEGQTEHGATWSIDNPNGEQPLQLHIRALVTGEPFDSPRRISLTEFEEGEFQKEAAPEVQCELSVGRTVMDGREVRGTFRARNYGSVARGAWARAMKSFESPLDLSSHPVIGLWIHGDGKGELLNVQLSNPQQETFESYEEQYVRIDFRGWRYYELPLIERSTGEFLDYQWPYGAGRWYILTGRSRPRNRMHRFIFYFNEIPPGQEVQCSFSAVAVLREKNTPPAISGTRTGMLGIVLLCFLILQEVPCSSLSR